MNCNSDKKVLLTPDGLKILSLFDGMACAMLALIEAGIKVSRYVAYEIDKYAVQTTSHNFPFIEHMGDVFETDFAQYKGFDILMGGSPCTYWSIAQKSNRETEASGMGAKTGLYAMPIEYCDGIPIKAVSGADGKTYSVYEVKDGVITINNKQYPIKLEDGYYIIRKLTVSECMRLQTVPEWYEFPVSDTQAYKMLGNGWTVSVIAHLLNGIKATQQSEI